MTCGANRMGTSLLWAGRNFLPYQKVGLISQSPGVTRMRIWLRLRVATAVCPRLLLVVGMAPPAHMQAIRSRTVPQLRRVLPVVLQVVEPEEDTVTLVDTALAAPRRGKLQQGRLAMGHLWQAGVSSAPRLIIAAVLQQHQGQEGMQGAPQLQLDSTDPAEALVAPVPVIIKHEWKYACPFHV